MPASGCQGIPLTVDTPASAASVIWLTSCVVTPRIATQKNFWLDAADQLMRTPSDVQASATPRARSAVVLGWLYENPSSSVQYSMCDEPSLTDALACVRSYATHPIAM